MLTLKTTILNMLTIVTLGLDDSTMGLIIVTVTDVSVLFCSEYKCKTNDRVFNCKALT